MNIWDSDTTTLKRLAREIKAENRTFSAHLTALPRARWDAQAARASKPLINVWRSREFLVQMYDHGDVYRLSINRTVVDVTNRRWRDEITWDDLQEIKHMVGLGEHTAIEVFPADADLVNVANIRHLWVWKDCCPLDFIWKKGEQPD